MVRSTLFIVGLLCAGAAAQQPEGPRVYRVAGVSAPRILEKQEPQYTEEARIAKLQGTVLVSAVVRQDGQARELRVVRSLGLGLDESAVAAVSQWRFDPGMKDGQPVAVASTIEVNFRLLPDMRAWHLARANFSVPQGATQPKVVSAPYPASTGPEQTSAVTLSFDVNEQGIPINIHVENSSDPQWEDEVTALIREWRFQAAMRNGSPVAAHGTLDFGRGEVDGPQPVAAKPVTVVPRKQ